MNESRDPQAPRFNGASNPRAATGIRDAARRGPGPHRSLRSHAINLTLVLAMVLLATVPFLNKAFHIDDHFYLQVARQILKDPWRPYDFQWVAQGEVCNAYENDWSPPFFKYVLALGLMAFGEKELPLHAIQGVFTACAAVSMYALAMRFSPRPILATALVILNPLFIPSQNLMLDTPSLALGLGGMALYVWGTDRSNLAMVMLGGFVAGLAVITKYPALMMLPLMLLYSLGKRSWLALPGLCMAAVPFVLWCAQNLSVHGSLHFVEPVIGGASISALDYGRRFLSVVNIVGSGFFAFLLVPHVMLPRLVHVVVWVLCLLVSGIRVLVWSEPYGILIPHHFVFFAGGLFLLVAGTLCVLKRGVGAIETGDRLFLLAWLFLGCFAAVGSQFIAVRHVLWALPAAALVATRFLFSAKFTRWRGALLAGFVGGIGLSVGWGDMEYANQARIQIELLAPRIIDPSWPTYYLGEDGFSYYSTAAGLRPLLVREEFRDRLAGILCSSSTSWSLPADLKKQLFVWKLIHSRGKFPVVTMSHGVNFFRTGTSDIPWAIGRTTVMYTEYYLADPYWEETR